MAKSLHAKSRKRARAAMRVNVGSKHVAKILRKTTRRHLNALAPAGAEEVAREAVKSMLGGVKGASVRLVTTAPTHTKALRYTFNHALRAKRLEDELEDLTDDEAAEAADAEAADEAAEADEEEAMLAAGGGGGAGAAAVEQAGRTKHPDKPLPKREMSASYYDWANLDLAQPNAVGMWDETYDGRRGLRHKVGRGAGKMGKGKTTGHKAVGDHNGIFDRLAAEAKRGVLAGGGGPGGDRRKKPLPPKKR